MTVKVDKNSESGHCPYCKDPLRNSDTTTHCGACGTSYHLECFTDGCIVFGCTNSGKHSFFVKYWGFLGLVRLKRRGIFRSEALAKLISTPGVELLEKSELTSPDFENKYWLIYLPRYVDPQVLSTIGLLKAIEKYGDVEFHSGPYRARSYAEDELSEIKWGAHPD